MRIACLRDYISSGNVIEGLIVTLKKPFKWASADKKRRWIKYIFDINNIVDFSPHSFRAALTSKAKRIYVDVDEIIRKGYWRNRSDKEIVEYDPKVPDLQQLCQK